MQGWDDAMEVFDGSVSNAPNALPLSTLYETRIDIWTIKNRKKAELGHRYIFRKFQKYWIIYLLAYSYLWNFSTSFYRLGLYQLISNPMGIAEQENTSRTTEQQNTKKHLQNGDILSRYHNRIQNLEVILVRRVFMEELNPVGRN